MEIKGKTAIVTGAGAGFGNAITKKLVAEGCRVAAFDINEGALLELEKDCDGVFPVFCNVADNVSVENSIAKTIDEFGKIDILVNNAGIMKNAPLINLLSRPDKRHPVDLWDQVITTNLSSVFYMTRSVVDVMVSNRTKGVIINISSISANGNIGQTAYSASKAGVEAMSAVWAKELGRLGIRSVAIAPGFINTAGTHDALEEKMLKQWVDKTPLGRTGAVDDVVGTVIFAIQNEFVSGTVLEVDGGLTL